MIEETNNLPSQDVADSERSGDRRLLTCSALFEAVDASGDEYYTIGIWPTLKDAVEAIMSCDEPSDLGSDGEPEEYCLVEIRERKIGFSGVGKAVWKRTWKMSGYEEESCNYTWTSEVESLPNVKSADAGAVEGRLR